MADERRVRSASVSNIGISRAGGLGYHIASNDTFLATVLRKSVTFPAIPEGASDVATSVQHALEEIAKLRHEGFQVVEFEKGQERVKWYHAVRLHSYIVLKLRKVGREQAEDRFARIEWGTNGVSWGAAEADERSVVNAKGLIYPVFRRYTDVEDPVSVLQRIRRLIISHIADKEFSMADFNSGHFAKVVVAELLSPASSLASTAALSTPRQEEVLAPEINITGAVDLVTVPETHHLSYSEENVPQPTVTPTTSARSPKIEQLEAIDSNGQRLELWCSTVAQQVQDTGKAQGQTVKNPPEKARLGQGAFGWVWRARDPLTGTVYAVKNAKEQDAKREVELVHHLHAMAAHPCILQLYHAQYFKDVRLVTIVMEYCAGGDLNNICTIERTAAGRSGRNYVEPKEAIVWLAQVLLALEHLHLETKSLLRDLKPPNVLLDESKRYAKLADFGLGRVGVECDGSWSLGGPTGTPGYISPEILAQEKYNFRADLYSFGVLMWVMATGGVSNSNSPQPPSSARMMQPGAGTRALNEDWTLMQEAASHPQGAGIGPPVFGEQRDLILSLTVRKPEDRPDHERVRGHAYFANLRLPSRGASTNAVHEWISSAIQR